MVLKLLNSRAGIAAEAHLKWIKASVGSTVRLIPVEEVIYFQSDEKYTRVVMTDSEVLVRKPIKELLEELDPNRFWQIHRSTIVNTHAIAGVTRGLRDQADMKLKGRPEALTVSRRSTLGLPEQPLALVRSFKDFGLKRRADASVCLFVVGKNKGLQFRCGPLDFYAPRAKRRDF